MSEVLFERYKDALRRGHVAAQRGRPDEALIAYREAIDIAPERALPYVGLGGVLAQLGRSDEALIAFDRAVERGPQDEGAWRGRADALIVAGRRIEAAEALDRLTGILDRQGRLADATDVALHALALAESRDRRNGLKSFVKRLRTEGGDPASLAALGRALEIVDDPTSPSDAPAAVGVSAGPATPGFLPMAAQPDRVDLLAAAEAAMDDGDVDALRSRAIAASAAQRDEGLFEAALDTCYLALGAVPADPDIHLALAGLYLDRGWRASAIDKIILLGRLADLTDDEATRDRLAALVAERLPDEPRLATRYG